MHQVSDLIIQNITIGLIASTIFYIIIIYNPQKRQNKIAKDHIIKVYINCKFEIYQYLIIFLKPKEPKGSILFDQILNYNLIRESLTNDMNKLQNHDSTKDFNLLNKRIISELEILKRSLNHLLNYQFIQKNESGFNIIYNHIKYINKLKTAYELYYRDDDNYDYSKWICNFIDDFICGYDLVNGKYLEHDDFGSYIENIYKESLFMKKHIFHYFNKCKNWIKNT